MTERQCNMDNFLNIQVFVRNNEIDCYAKHKRVPFWGHASQMNNP